MFPELVDLSSLLRSCVLIIRDCPNAIKLVRVPRHEAYLFQVDLSVFLNELTWSAASACEDVLEFIATDPITPADVKAGDGLCKVMCIAWHQYRRQQ